MNVSIVIPTWRGRHLLEAYLPSIIEASDFYSLTQNAQTEIIVVEDCGGDDTIAWLKSNHGDRIQALEHSKNLGFCSACQTGFVNAQHPVVLLLNNDVRLEKDCIHPFIEHFKDPQVFAVTGKMYNQKGTEFCNGGKIGHFRRGMWSSYRNYDAQAVSGASYLSFAAIAAFSAYDRKKFLDIGGFDQLVAMYEDIEISYRAWKLGWQVKYEPRSVAYHDASQSMKRRYSRRSLNRLCLRSRILMHWILLNDPGMFSMHAASMLGRLLISWLWLDWPFYWAVFTSLKNLSAVRQRRVHNRNNMARADRELVNLLEQFYKTAPIKIL
jgi:GT2 family glycosyltransferase